MDYRVLFSRQKLMQDAHFFKEVDLDGRIDPSELHRKLSRRLTQLGLQIAEENLGIVRRPVGDAVGDVFAVLHGVAVKAVPNAGVIVYGAFKSQAMRTVQYESHIRLSMTGEYYPQERRSNLTVLISGSVEPFEHVPEAVLRKEKTRWLYPQAQEAYGSLREEVGRDVAEIEGFAKLQKT